MTEKNIVPNLEAKASEGNAVFTLRNWSERFRQFTKREHKRDITPLMKGEVVADSGCSEKKLILEDFIWEVGPEALHQKTRAEDKTEPGRIKIKDFSGYSPSTTYQNATLTTTEETSSGTNKRKQNQPKSSGEE